MKKLRALTLACVTFVLLSSFTRAYAESRAKTVTFSLGSGRYYFSSKRHLENTGMPFVALGYNFTDHWGIEGLVGKMNTTSHSNVNDESSVSGTLVSVDGLYHFNAYRHALEPYLMAGVGALGLNPNALDPQYEGNVNAGIGVNMLTDKVVMLRAEVRDIYTIVGGKNDVYLDAGITFLLDVC